MLLDFTDRLHSLDHDSDLVTSEESEWIMTVTWSLMKRVS